jgi:hypothetical protein
MRTTLAIDDHLLRQLKDRAHRTGQPLKKVVNEALRAGLYQRRKPPRPKAYRSKTYAMGYPPQGCFDKALGIAATLEDEEIARKLMLRK